MSVQDALQAAGIVSCAVAVLLAVLTFYSFVTQDIPAVLDDLSGKRRMRALESGDGGVLLAVANDAIVVEDPTQVMTLAQEIGDTVADVAVAEDDDVFEMRVRIVLCSCHDPALWDGDAA